MSWARGRVLISSAGSERATSGSGGKIVSFAGRTHVVWQDSTPEGYFNRIRTVDRDSGEWSPIYTLNQAYDNHARPVVTIDGAGHLHVIMSGHHTPVTYRRSLRPNDASVWSTEETVCSGTYPLLMCGADGTLYLILRHGEDWKGLELHVKPQDTGWENRGLLVKKGVEHAFYAAFYSSVVWGPDHHTLHMGVSFYEGTAIHVPSHERRLLRDETVGAIKVHSSGTSGTFQAVGYMRSPDLGRTWEKADGTPVALPVRPADIDLLAIGESEHPKPGIKLGGIAVDSCGSPSVIFISHSPNPGRAFMATTDGSGGWEERPLTEAIEERWPGYGVVDCVVSMTEDDVLCLMPTLVPIDHPEAQWTPRNEPPYYGRPEAWVGRFPEITRIGWLESHDGGHSFAVRDVVPREEGAATLLPNIERPTGFNHIPAGSLPSFLYFVGESRYPRDDEVISNTIYWVPVA